MSEPQAALAWCPFPDAETARDIAAQMLAEKLIACANILPQVESVFLWEGKVDTASEVAVLFKTDSENLAPLVKRLGECHPYDTPAVVGWRCDAAHEATLQWLGETLGDA